MPEMCKAQVALPVAAVGQETGLHTVIAQETFSDDDGQYAYEDLPVEFDDDEEDNLEDYNFLKAETKALQSTRPHSPAPLSWHMSSSSLFAIPYVFLILG